MIHVNVKESKWAMAFMVQANRLGLEPVAEMFPTGAWVLETRRSPEFGEALWRIIGDVPDWRKIRREDVQEEVDRMRDEWGGYYPDPDEQQALLAVRTRHIDHATATGMYDLWDG